MLVCRDSIEASNSAVDSCYAQLSSFYAYFPAVVLSYGTYADTISRSWEGGFSNVDRFGWELLRMLDVRGTTIAPSKNVMKISWPLKAASVTL